MLSQLGIPQPSLKLVMDETTVFLHPSPAPEVVPSNDPILQGVLVLNLPKPKRIKSFSVRLVRYYNLSFPDFAYETGQCTEAEVSIEGCKSERLLDKGVHKFAFTIVVPSSSAPFERCQYGRVYHKLVAVARGDGIMGSDITTEKEVHLIVNPADEGETQDLNIRIESFNDEIGPYAVSTATQHLTVGGILYFDLLLASPPTNLKILSVNAFIIATYSITSIEYPKKPLQRSTHKRQLFHLDSENRPDEQTEYGDVSPLDSRLESVSPVLFSPSPSAASCSSTVAPPSPYQSPLPGPSWVPIPLPTLRTQARENTTNTPQSSSFRNPLVKSKSLPLPAPPQIPLQTVPTGRTYQLTHLARLPNDDFIRPSTMEGTKTPLRVAHELVFEVRFQAPDGFQTPNASGVKVLRVSRPITISSCCCMLESLLVPSYSETKPDSIEPPFGAMASCWMDSCVCGASTEKLVAQQRAAGLLFQQRYEGMPVKAEYRRSATI